MCFIHFMISGGQFHKNFNTSVFMPARKSLKTVLAFQTHLFRKKNIKQFVAHFGTFFTHSCFFKAKLVFMKLKDENAIIFCWHFEFQFLIVKFMKLSPAHILEVNIVPAPGFELRTLRLTPIQKQLLYQLRYLTMCYFLHSRQTGVCW